MTKTLILSHDTVCQLLEAHASMAAWYYQLTNALRAAGGDAQAPDERQRLAVLEQIATHFPEVAEVARGIERPRPYLPPPVMVPPPAGAEAATSAPPATTAATDADGAADEASPPPPPPARVDATGEQRDEGPPPPPSTSPDGEVAPPPLVDPKKVRYE